MSLSKEQIEQFYKLLTPFVTTLPSNNSLLAQRVTFFTAIIGSGMTFDPWVFDSRATYHMTGCANLFTTYSPSLGNIKIRIADGTFSAIVGIRSIKIALNCTLLSVFHVLRLICNILSISKITKDMNCKVKF